ncbi:MAG: arginine--tRNA ligase [Nitrospinota bacterium]|nr:arginine--tRNA ligase [Nitrospinota bacterium]
MKETVKNLITDALKRAKNEGVLILESTPDIVIEEPKDEKLGDFATTLAMQLARPEKKNPKLIAEIICGFLNDGVDLISSAEVAGPGFINIKMSGDFFLNGLREAIRLGSGFGQSDIGGKKKVLVEFVSANPTGPLHVGHGRGAAVGHALSCLLKKAGYDVSTEYYINDVGNQMNNLGRSTWMRYKERLGKHAVFPEDGYQGDYIKDIAQEIIDKDGSSHLDKKDEDALTYFRQYSKDSILDGIRNDLKEFRVEFDRWFSEASLDEDDSVNKSIHWLREKGFVYDKDGATWVKTSQFKDDADRVIIKQGGERTYFCSDIAYHKNKVDRGYDLILDLWGADHHGYVPRMQSVLEAMGYSQDVFKVLLVQFVTLKRGGQKVSMSTRSGEFETLADVVAEVGVDATRFFFLMRSSDSHLDFDLDLAKKESPENPVYYIQYAHARVCSVFRTAEEQGVPAPNLDSADLSLLREEEEFALMKKILTYPACIEKSAQSQEIHRIAFYLQELVSIFHSYYKQHRVVTDNRELTLARLLLLDCLRNVIASGLNILGVSAPEKM